jgi:hypothetical protein
MIFNSKNASEKYALLVADNVSFDNTTDYIYPLIEKALLKIKDNQDKSIHEKNLKELIPVAAKRFLSNPDNIRKEVKFSVYFTWYINKEIN